MAEEKGTVHKSYWISADLAQRVADYSSDNGMRISAGVSDLLERGLASTAQEPTRADQTAAEGPDVPEAHKEADPAVVEVLRASNADLRAEVSHLWAELARRDEQIQVAHELADQAHRLHAAEVSRALPDGRHMSFAEKVAAIFRRDS